MCQREINIAEEGLDNVFSVFPYRIENLGFLVALKTGTQALLLIEHLLHMKTKFKANFF